METAILAAVRQSLVEDGFEGTTIPAVARRAGVGAPTVYRRWPTQIELVEAIFDEIFLEGELEVPSDEGDFAQVVSEVVGGAYQFFGDPAARRALPGLLAAYNGDPTRYTALTERIEVPARNVFRHVHSTAAKQGRVARRPTADALFGMIIGTVFYHAAIRGETDVRMQRDNIDLVMQAARPSVRSA